MENLSENGNRGGSVPEDVSEAEEIRIVLEYMVDAKKKLSSFLLGEIQDPRVRAPDRARLTNTKVPDQNIDLAENKSISTGASMENVFMNIQKDSDNMFSQQTFKCEESHHFCKNVLIPTNLDRK